MGADVHARGMFTLPELDLSARDHRGGDGGRSQRVAGRPRCDTDKFLITLGGEHSITSPIVARGRGAARRASASCRSTPTRTCATSYLGERHSHACAMRRTLEYAPLVQVGIRNISGEEVAVLPSLQDDDLLRLEHAGRSGVDRRAVVDALSEHVYITIDLDGLEPGLMPAVGTPEPGGLSWRELTTLLRRVVRTPHASSPATSSSCVRSREWRRRISSPPSWSTSC